MLISAAALKETGNLESVQLRNGWYEVFKKTAGDKIVVAMYLLKHEFSIENQYLVNGFNEALKLPPHTQISQVKNERIFPVKSASGKLLFSLSFNAVDSVGYEHSSLGMLYLFSLFTFLLFCYLYIQYLFKKNPIHALLLIIAVVLLRVLSIIYHFPDAVYDLPLFSPKYYASSFMLNSLGDLLISSVIFCFIITSLYYFFIERERPAKYPQHKISDFTSDYFNLDFYFYFFSAY